MEIFRTKKELQQAIAHWKGRKPSKKVGFIPTMGALHEGHISLVDAAKLHSDLIIVSVFVNPAQFNDQSDLERYPRTESADADLLNKNGCDILFLPPVNEVYPIGEAKYEIELDGLDSVMEGTFRPGHFKGVCNVVEKLFRIVKPDIAFFGIKDFQQAAIIKHMVNLRGLPVEILACPIKRNDGGLALSSRNALLSEQEKEDARIINWTLRLAKILVQEGKSLKIVKENVQALFSLGQLKLEYMEIVHNDSLKPVKSITENISICLAAYCGKVRLIDNIQLN
ncbi:MAG: pantoate--beta-alanine ligase [Crocinitomicaceae bacterium]